LKWVCAIRSGACLVSSAGRSADEQVAGVQAQRDGRTLEHPADLVAALDHGPDVRVQHGIDAVRGGQAGEPVEVGEQRRPARLV